MAATRGGAGAPAPPVPTPATQAQAALAAAMAGSDPLVASMERVDTLVRTFVEDVGAAVGAVRGHVAAERESAAQQLEAVRQALAAERAALDAEREAFAAHQASAEQELESQRQQIASAWQELEAKREADTQQRAAAEATWTAYRTEFERHEAFLEGQRVAQAAAAQQVRARADKSADGCAFLTGRVQKLESRTLALARRHTSADANARRHVRANAPWHSGAVARGRSADTLAWRGRAACGTDTRRGGTASGGGNGCVAERRANFRSGCAGRAARIASGGRASRRRPADCCHRWRARRHTCPRRRWGGVARECRAYTRAASATAASATATAAGVAGV